MKKSGESPRFAQQVRGRHAETTRDGHQLNVRNTPKSVLNERNRILIERRTKARGAMGQGGLGNARALRQAQSPNTLASQILTFHTGPFLTAAV